SAGAALRTAEELAQAFRDPRLASIAGIHLAVIEARSRRFDAARAKLREVEGLTAGLENDVAVSIVAILRPFIERGESSQARGPIAAPGGSAFEPPTSKSHYVRVSLRCLEAARRSGAGDPKPGRHTRGSEAALTLLLEPTAAWIQVKN